LAFRSLTAIDHREEDVVRHRSEAGETLIEIVLTIVLIGLTVGALLAGIGTAAAASKQHRDLATSDTVMRSYAEATKQAVRSQCTASGGTYAVSYTPPAGYAVSGAGTTCPAPTTTQSLPLVVTEPDGNTTRMTIVVRTP
jgi:type II secretory pathway pseudopilin PulG